MAQPNEFGRATRSRHIGFTWCGWLENLGFHDFAGSTVVQLVGAGTAFAWAFGLGLAMFFLISKTVGLRVTAEEELKGLDIGEGARTAKEVRPESSGGSGSLRRSCVPARLLFGPASTRDYGRRGSKIDGRGRPSYEESESTTVSRLGSASVQHCGDAALPQQWQGATKR